jgi:MFS transporter, DHA2 family, multidrug resistance protein
MVPTNNIALGTLAPDRVKNASGLFNLMRNLAQEAWPDAEPWG